MDAVLNGILGGWQFNGVGRIQARTINFGNVRLVGMTRDELQSMYKHEIRDQSGHRPADGLHAARRHHPEHAAGIQRQHDVADWLFGTLGVPEGRYIAPANGPDCIQLKAGDCAPRTLLIRAPVVHALRHRRHQAVPDQGGR